MPSRSHAPYQNELSRPAASNPLLKLPCRARDLRVAGVPFPLGKQKFWSAFSHDARKYQLKCSHLRPSPPVQTSPQRARLCHPATSQTQQRCLCAGIPELQAVPATAEPVRVLKCDCHGTDTCVTRAAVPTSRQWAQCCRDYPVPGSRSPTPYWGRRDCGWCKLSKDTVSDNQKDA